MTAGLNPPGTFEYECSTAECECAGCQVVLAVVVKIRGKLPMAWENGQWDPRDDPKEGEEGQAGNWQVVKPESVKNINLFSVCGGGGGLNLL
jgi:hypothetical protein